MTSEELITKWSPHVSLEEAYKHGYDYGKNGPTPTNCSFTLFQSTEHTKAWERGRDEARQGAESTVESQSTDSRRKQ